MKMDSGVRPTSSSPSDQIGATVPDGSNAVYVTSLKPADVLLGRGAPIISYEGNVQFRDLVRSKKPLYVSTGRHQAKDEIAREIVREIGRQGGRFLKKVHSPEERQAQQKSREDPLWRVADDSIVMEKVKQALRDKERSKTDGRLDNKEVVAQFSGISPLVSLSSPGLGLGGASSMLINPLGSSLLQSQYLGLSDRGLLGGANLLPPLSGTTELDPHTVSILLQRQRELRDQQLQALEFQMRQNDQLGAIRTQAMLRSLQQLQQSSGLIDPTLEGAAAAIQARNNSMGFLPPEATLSNTEMAMLLQPRRIQEMRPAAVAQMPSSNQDNPILFGAMESQAQPADGTADDKFGGKANDSSSSSSVHQKGNDGVEEDDEDDPPVAKRLKRAEGGS